VQAAGAGGTPPSPFFTAAQAAGAISAIASYQAVPADGASIRWSLTAPAARTSKNVLGSRPESFKAQRQALPVRIVPLADREVKGSPLQLLQSLEHGPVLLLEQSGGDVYRPLCLAFYKSIGLSTSRETPCAFLEAQRMTVQGAPVAHLR